MKRLFNLFAIGLLLAACDMEQQEPQVKVQSTYSVECASYDFTDENGIATKSVIGVDKSGSDGSQKVSNWNIWVYDHSTGNIVNNGGKNIYDETMKTFFRQTSGIDGDLLFPDENGHYDIYILTNVEQITSVPATASAAAAYNYTFQNYNSFKPENGGFPMATVYSNFCPATAASHTFMVKRLVSKYDVVIVNDIPDSEFILSSVKLKQGAKKINPFQENSKISLETEAGEDYDMFKVSELVKKDAVTYTGELYMLENNQGQVFNSSVSTDKERIPDNMIIARNGKLCTYVEFAGNIAMKDGHGQNNIKFRHYFGSGRNAGVMRNINTTVTLTLKTCPNDSDEDWRIVPEDPYDTRTVVFNPNPVEIVADGSWYDVTVTPKAGDPLELNNYIDYRLECPDASSASLSFDGVTMGSTVSGQKTLRIKSSYSGSTPTTIKVNAYIDDKKVSEFQINVMPSSAPSDDYEIVTMHLKVGGDAGISSYEFEYNLQDNQDGYIHPLYPNTSYDVFTNKKVYILDYNNYSSVLADFDFTAFLSQTYNGQVEVKYGINDESMPAASNSLGTLSVSDDQIVFGIGTNQNYFTKNSEFMTRFGACVFGAASGEIFVNIEVNKMSEPVTSAIPVYINLYSEGGASNLNFDGMVDDENYTPTDQDYYGLHINILGGNYYWYSPNSPFGLNGRSYDIPLIYSLKGNFWDEYFFDCREEDHDPEEYGIDVMDMSCLDENGYSVGSLSGNDMLQFSRAFDPHQSHTWLIYFRTYETRNTTYTSYFSNIYYYCKDKESGQNVTLERSSVKSYVQGEEGSQIFYDSTHGTYAEIYSYTRLYSGNGGGVTRGMDIPFYSNWNGIADKYEVLSIRIDLDIEHD